MDNFDDENYGGEDDFGNLLRYALMNEELFPEKTKDLIKAHIWQFVDLDDYDTRKYHKRSGGSKKKAIAAKQNPWILHVKKVAKKYNMKYGDALKIASQSYRR